MTDHMKGTAMAPRTAPLSAWAALYSYASMHGGQLSEDIRERLRRIEEGQDQ